MNTKIFYMHLSLFQGESKVVPLFLKIDFHLHMLALSQTTKTKKHFFCKNLVFKYPDFDG